MGHNVAMSTSIFSGRYRVKLTSYKVSKDFVSGKRQRYSNPFQFYLTVSILFFLIVGLTNTYQEFREFSDGGTQKPPPRMVKADNVKVLDSVAKTTQNNLKTTFQSTILRN